MEWGAIWTIACVLGRHVFSQNAKGTTFPNLYVLMVGPPATGKSEIEDLIKPLLQDVNIKLCAEHVSKAAMIDEMEIASVKKITPTTLVDYHNLCLLTSEFVQTFPSYDVQFLGMLARWWDCPPYIRESKRHLKEPIQIAAPCCNMLAGIQPGILAHTFPPEAWNGGFCSRTIMVYVPKQIELMLYGNGAATAGRKLSKPRYERLKNDLQSITQLLGQMRQDETYVEAYFEWRRKKKEPEPRHPKMMYYNLRREHNLEKLSIISAASQGRMVLTGYDYNRARTWLESAESNVEDIFVEMGSGDDSAVMKDMHAFIVKIAGGANKQVREQVVRRFLTSRIGTMRMESFIDQSEKAGIIRICATGSGFRTVEAIPLDDLTAGM